MSDIRIRGARTHNLKNIDLDLPRNQLIVITGLSGSGKSSLAFDTLYAEGQRRYVQSLSAYARQFLELMEKPDVDLIEGLSPAIAIEQKGTNTNPRSTVGTNTEIYDYLRLLFARIGTPYCPHHHVALKAQTPSEIADKVLLSNMEKRTIILAPVKRTGRTLAELFEDLQARGYTRFRINGRMLTVDEWQSSGIFEETSETIEVVMDRLKVREDSRQRIAEALESGLKLSDGRVIVLNTEDQKEELFSDRFACPYCGFSVPKLEPKLFSFNSPSGSCPTCGGLGEVEQWDLAKVVGAPDHSLAAGAIENWDPTHRFNYQYLEKLSVDLGFSLNEPWNDLKKAVREQILWGTAPSDASQGTVADASQGTVADASQGTVADVPKETIGELRAPSEDRLSGSLKNASEKPGFFEGILPMTQRRFQQTDSPAVKTELGKWRSLQPCPACGGSRLCEAARNTYLENGEQKTTVHEITELPLNEASEYFKSLSLSGAKKEIGEKLIEEIILRLQFLEDVGLSYLSLSRRADTLSGGEAQRIRLAGQIGSRLSGVLYVLDEPSIGLHQSDNDKLIHTLKKLRDLGNTVVVVEHDEDTIREADYIVDMGPEAGSGGGQVCAQGTPRQIEGNPHSLTGLYLSGKMKVTDPTIRKKPDGRFLRVEGCSGHNLKNIDVSIPVGLMTVVTGVSGSGKSTLVNETIYAIAARALNRANTTPEPYRRVEGLEYFDKVIAVDQSPIGKTPRSNPATYTGVFSAIRDLFAEIPLSKERGYGPGRFSFNVKGGRCEACEGEGLIKVEMNFLPDIYVPCDVCGGSRYNRETLDVAYKGHNIAQVLEMTVDDALKLFENIPTIARKLQLLSEVGLGYITLGQSAVTLSGGESQRIKLAHELSKRGTGKTLYVLDEPTTGLHFHDVSMLLSVLEKIKEAGNTLLIIEHNLDVIRAADWVIDIGPGGGKGGGEIIAVGTPEELREIPSSKTAKYLGNL